MPVKSVELCIANMNVTSKNIYAITFMLNSLKAQILSAVLRAK